jgi:hypothetical protein
VVGISGWSSGTRLGLAVEFVNDVPVVTSVFPGGRAYRAGVTPGDSLLSIDSQPVTPSSWRQAGDHGESFTARSVSTGSIISFREDPNGVPSAGLASALILVSFAFFVVSALVELRASRNALIYRFSIFSMVSAIALAVAPASSVANPIGHTVEAYAIHWVPVAFFTFFLIFGRETISSSFRSKYGPVMIGATMALTLDVIWTLNLLAAPELTDLSRNLDLLFLAAGLISGIGRQQDRAQPGADQDCPGRNGSSGAPIRSVQPRAAHDCAEPCS